MAKGEKTFKTVTAVREFLEGQGFIATKSTVGRHQTKGLFAKSKAGVFEEAAVLRYAHANLKRSGSGKLVTQEEKDKADRKSEIEFKLSQEKYRRERIKRIKEEGGVISLDSYNQDLAARLAFFSLQLDGFAVQQAEAVVDVVLGKRLDRAEQLIDLVGGDADKVRELAAWLERLVPEMAEVYMVRKQQWLEAFARERVHVAELAEVVEAVGEVREEEADAAV